MHSENSPIFNVIYITNILNYIFITNILYYIYIISIIVILYYIYIYNKNLYRKADMSF